MIRLINKIGLGLSLLFAIYSCSEGTPKATQEKTKKTEDKIEASVIVPIFNADSAYAFVKAQTDFGPRTPGSEAHTKCAEWLYSKLKIYAPKVQIQEYRVRGFDGRTLNGKNIIASFNPEQKKRMILCAHWDSRPFADQETDAKLHNTAIDGANDGASGVGVILEIARLMKTTPTDIGVDVIFFDLEDLGPPAYAEIYENGDQYWAMGSQYWAQNPHEFGYTAKFGILLDMVGSKETVFFKEGFSYQFASKYVDLIWKTAKELGYSNLFIDEVNGAINDDHLPMNRYADIPTVDVIGLSDDGVNTFASHWHTTKDNIDAIDRETLGIVGKVITTVTYRQK
ncbi:MAG: M28 family peptidase [Hyphomicrobiales bacterium]